MPLAGAQAAWWAIAASLKAEPRMLSERERQFVERQRVARLATADGHSEPHVMPVCFALVDAVLYITVDEKPKKTGTRLKRLRNIAENPQVAVIIDHYVEDWQQLGWVMLRGRAEILLAGKEPDEAQSLLRARYPQLVAMQIGCLPVIAVRIARVTSWGNLAGPGQTP
jgi:PPOX class probable F420-dependent enzyme